MAFSTQMGSAVIVTIFVLSCVLFNWLIKRYDDDDDDDDDDDHAYR